MKYILLILFPFICHANIASELVTGSVHKEFSLKEVCHFLGVVDATHGTMASSSKISCLDKEFSINEFCQKKFSSDSMYTKARFDIDKRKLSCSFSRSVILELDCKDDYLKFCKNAKSSCMKLKKDFAYALKLSSSSILEVYPPKLKCFFQASNQISNFK